MIALSLVIPSSFFLFVSVLLFFRHASTILDSTISPLKHCYLHLSSVGVFWGGFALLGLIWRKQSVLAELGIAVTTMMAVWAMRIMWMHLLGANLETVQRKLDELSGEKKEEKQSGFETPKKEVQKEETDLKSPSSMKKPMLDLSNLEKENVSMSPVPMTPVIGTEKVDAKEFKTNVNVADSWNLIRIRAEFFLVNQYGYAIVTLMLLIVWMVIDMPPFEYQTLFFRSLLLFSGLLSLFGLFNVHGRIKLLICRYNPTGKFLYFTFIVLVTSLQPFIIYLVVCSLDINITSETENSSLFSDVLLMCYSIESLLLTLSSLWILPCSDIIRAQQDMKHRIEVYVLGMELAELSSNENSAKTLRQDVELGVFIPPKVTVSDSLE